jgi:hypothetical protein
MNMEPLVEWELVVPFCPPQISYDFIWDRTRVAAVESQLLTAWAMAWSLFPVKHINSTSAQGTMRNAHIKKSLDSNEKSCCVKEQDCYNL